MRFSSRGVSLTELMIAVSLLSVGVLGFFGAFQFITKSITVSRSRTIATNLAQEKVESLKNVSYYQLLITTAATTDASFTPALVYDSSNYPPETISIGGSVFRRYTYVALAQVDGNVVSTTTYTYPDTGLKQVTVHITWTQFGQQKKWTLTNLYENPNLNPLDSSFSGTVSSAATGVAIPGALVKVQENPDWNAVTDASGNYSFRVFHGTYTLRVTSAGWYDATSAITLAPEGSNVDLDFSLYKIATGTISGLVWLNDRVLVSQVVASTFTQVADLSTREVEYIELFNPTTYAINVGQTGVYPKDVAVNYHDEAIGQEKMDSAADFNFVHVATYIPPGRYYLIANATSFVAGGTWHNADAYYGTLYNAYVRNAQSGGIQLVRYDGTVLDSLGWEDNNNTPGVYEGDWIDLSASDGFQDGNQIVRVSSPGVSASGMAAYGRAYDSDDNTRDFVHPLITAYAGLTIPPRATEDAAQTVIAGRPANAAYVSADDPYSGSTRAYTAYVTSGSLNLPYARFDLTGITTGTWTVALASNTYYKVINFADVAAYQRTRVPNAATFPAWAVADHYSIALESAATSGFLEGRVTGVNGSPLSGIQILAGGASKTTGSNGSYFMQVSTGTVIAICNPNNADASYVELIASVDVAVGEIATQDFTLSQGGRIQGFVTTGTTPLPNVVIAAKIGGNQQGAGTSDATGVYTIKNLSTGTYTVEPTLEAGQDASPNSVAVTVTNTGTVDAGTFTVSGALGSIKGTVTDSATSDLITTGVLLVASTGTIAATPPAIAGSSAPALSPPLYSVSSKADGSFDLPVRGGGTYRLSAYYPVISPDGTSISVTTKTFTGIAVTAGLQTSFDITIP